jgi:hypothetical protein
VDEDDILPTLNGYEETDRKVTAEVSRASFTRVVIDKRSSKAAKSVTRKTSEKRCCCVMAVTAVRLNRRGVSET